MALCVSLWRPAQNVDAVWPLPGGPDPVQLLTFEDEACLNVI
jgi:hypothetical protein